ncbi:MAG: hypothetical protein K9J13_14640 [Saprospiraceae bacterium]|nr:hypothetical protein [Saprospiraceae bacterium]
MNKHLMIHFSHIVRDAKVGIYNENNIEIEAFHVENMEFVNINLPLEKGNYQVKITEGNKETVKLIIVNN